MRSTSPRYVADDFGLCPSVDSAVLQLARAGLLDGVSVLVNTAEIARVRELASLPGLEIGLHLNLTQGTPVSDDARLGGLVCLAGSFRGLLGFTISVAFGHVDEEAIAHEALAQWEALSALAGRVDYVDGHQHVQYLPAVVRVLRRVCGTERRVPIRLGRMSGPRWSLRSALLALARRRALHQLAGPDAAGLICTRDQLIDYGRPPTGALDGAEVMLHVADPRLPAPELAGSSYSYRDRVAQFEWRLAAQSPSF